MKTEVLVTGALHESAMTLLNQYSAFKIVYKPDVARDELLNLVKNAQILISRSETDVDKALIEAAPNLKIIARAAVGVGNIDIDFATLRGILVMNCPGQNTNSAAELTLGLVLSALRRIPDANNKIKSGGWDRHSFTGRELRKKRIGIIGLGNVGHRVAKFARGFDMDVYAYDPYIAPEVFQRNGAVAVGSLLELARSVDILSLHVPLNKETRHMVGEDVLAALPKGSYLINAARGGLVNEEVLLKFLESGHLAGAGIDTFVSEPKPSPKLVNHPRVWCTPHIGASTDEAQRAIGVTVVDQVIKAHEGGVVDFPINLPAVGVMDKPLLKSYAVLAEKLGSMVGQLLDFNPVRVEIRYRGDLAAMESSMVRLSWMKGYASQVMDDYVSFVNVEKHFENLGIKISEQQDPDFDSYKSALKFSLFGASSEQVLTIGGIVFDDRYLRVSLINDYYFEMDPVGTLLIIENHDRPGVVGDVGHFLAKNRINIDSFALSRNRKGGVAMAIVRTDSEPAVEDLREMRKIQNIVSVKAVVL